MVEAGFVAGLAAAGQALCARGVSDFRYEQAKEVARTMFSAPVRPDAVFCANDHMAFAVMDVLRFELGLSVPGDVSVVGYDDVKLAAWPSYDLTTVRQPAGQMAEATIGILMDRLADPETRPRRVALDGPLIIRGSARIPKGWNA